MTTLCSILLSIVIRFSLFLQTLICCQYELLQYDNGGPVIDLGGKVVGMVNDPERFESFIPSSIVLNCLDSWRKYRYVFPLSSVMVSMKMCSPLLFLFYLLLEVELFLVVSVLSFLCNLMNISYV